MYASPARSRVPANLTVFKARGPEILLKSEPDAYVRPAAVLAGYNALGVMDDSTRCSRSPGRSHRMWTVRSGGPGEGRPAIVLFDLPCFGRPTRLVWHLSSVTGPASRRPVRTAVGDEVGLYNPSDFNDRLLLA